MPITDGFRRIWHGRSNDQSAARTEADDPTHDRRIGSLERRVAHLEAMLEGLQDAFHRHSVQQDVELEELRRQLQPSEIARALSDDARKRGL